MGLEEKGKRLIVHTAARRRTEKEKRPRRPKTAGERLLRNTAVACAILFCATALSRLDTPWSRKALETARSAMTLRVDVAGPLAKLAFVRELFPETALVFWNLGEDDLYLAPVSGEAIHAWSEERPYTELSCQPGDPVRAAGSGKVESVRQGVNGQWIVTLSHEGGATTRYAYLSETVLSQGDSVLAGDVLGPTAEDYVFFELNIDGQSADPGDFRAGQFQ